MISKTIAVEHSLYDITRYRILSDRLRIHDTDLYDNILAVCARLWNLYLSKSLIFNVATTLMNLRDINRVI